MLVVTALQASRICADGVAQASRRRYQEGNWKSRTRCGARHSAVLAARCLTTTHAVAILIVYTHEKTGGQGRTARKRNQRRSQEELTWKSRWKDSSKSHCPYSALATE
jgi:hypothetical protein